MRAVMQSKVPCPRAYTRKVHGSSGVKRYHSVRHYKLDAYVIYFCAGIKLAEIYAHSISSVKLADCEIDAARPICDHQRLVNDIERDIRGVYISCCVANRSISSFYDDPVRSVNQR